MNTVRKRIMFLLTTLVAAFLVGVVAWKAVEEKQAHLLYGNAKQEKTRFLQKLGDVKGRSLATFANIFTFWDDMANFVHTHNKTWAQGVVDTVLVPFETDNVWIFDKKGALIYNVNSNKDAHMLAIRLPDSALHTLTATQPYTHFFMNTPCGLMELRGATIHRTNDVAHTGPYYGYFFVGRLWNQTYIQDLEALTDCRIALKTDKALATPSPKSKSDIGTVAFSVPFADWQGRDVGRMDVVSEVPIIPLVKHSTGQALKLSVTFVLVLIGLLFACLLGWVSVPLKAISDCLQSEQPEALHKLQRNTTEFGQVSRLIAAFFEQKSQLVTEIAERKQAQEELRQAHEVLEQRVLERTATLATTNEILEEEIRVRKVAEAERAEAARELQQRNKELVEARDAALAAARLKSEFLANTSHEIRTPLNGIMGLLLVLNTTELDRGQRAYLQTIKESADALLAIITDILDFSKIEAGKMTIERVDFCLRSVLEESAALLALKAEEKSLQFCCDLPPQLSAAPAWAECLQGDPARLRQIILNLLGNAIKFTPTGGEVVLGAKLLSESKTQARWRLFVQDTGIGIAPRQQEMIFESFTQGDGSSTRKYGGTGLGLTICRQLITLLGGEIGVESELGKGSLFWVEFTLEKQTHTLMELPAPASLEGRRVLVADKQAAVRRTLAAQLTAWNCLPIEAADADELTAILNEMKTQRQSCDLLLLDTQWPEVEAGNFLPRLALHPALMSKPICALLPFSAQTAADSLTGKSMLSGLNKPIRTQELLTLLLGLFPEENAGGASNVSHSQEGGASASNKMFNYERLALTAGGSTEMESRLLQEFLTSAPKTLVRCEFSIDAQDGVGLEHWAEQLIGNCKGVGADVLAQWCEKLASCGHQEIWGEAGRTMQAMQEVWAQTRHQGEQFLAETNEPLAKAA